MIDDNKSKSSLMNFILHSFREFHNLSENELAQKISISLEEYNNIESGLIRVDAQLATKLSKLYNAPSSLFLFNQSTQLSIIYTHCHFENSSGFVNHLYYDDESLIKAKEEAIFILKEEVRQLREQNSLLFKRMLDSKL